MTTSFYDSHLDTIVKLKALADKHGMKIRFGTTSSLKVDTEDMIRVITVHDLIMDAFHNTKDKKIQDALLELLKQVYQAVEPSYLMQQGNNS